mmetsp:Transcript_32549/g.36407  ORF Transcript_32549/g.36407 Transcript_32549/m.36407 type:complete len:138 (+) Transcript_32549:106-519(+)
MWQQWWKYVDRGMGQRCDYDYYDINYSTVCMYVLYAICSSSDTIPPLSLFLNIGSLECSRYNPFVVAVAIVFAIVVHHSLLPRTTELEEARTIIMTFTRRCGSLSVIASYGTAHLLIVLPHTKLYCCFPFSFLVPRN